MGDSGWRVGVGMGMGVVRRGRMRRVSRLVRWGYPRGEVVPVRLDVPFCIFDMLISALLVVKRRGAFSFFLFSFTFFGVTARKGASLEVWNYMVVVYCMLVYPL